jgi:hypothetical protein
MSSRIKGEDIFFAFCLPCLSSRWPISVDNTVFANQWLRHSLQSAGNGFPVVLDEME